EFHRINHPTATTTRLQVQVNLREYSDINWTRLQLEPEYGNEPGFSLTLYDDGSHGDELAGDNIWGGSIDIENRKYPFRSNLFIYGSQKGITLNKFHSGLTLRPKPELINWRVSYENGRQDGKVSHSEKVHLAFDIRNPGGLNGMDDVTLRNLNFKQSPTTITNIPAGAVVSGASLFLKLIAPATGDSFDIPFSVEFDHNTFSGRLSRPITPWDARYNWGDTLEVTALSGNPENLLPIVADPALLTGHQYMVTFREDTLRHTLFWRLTDLTTTHIRLDDLPVGTDPEAEFPIVNGIEWKVFNPESLYVIHKHSGSAGVVEIASAGAQFAPARLDDAARPFRGNSLWPGETSSSEYDIRTGTGAPPQAGTVIPFITTQSIQPTDTFLVQAPDPPVGPQVPFSFQLGQNYPNPFNHETLIPLYISKDTHLRLDIFNILGQKVRTLVNEKLVWGDHLLRWDGRNNAGNTVASGLYIYRIKVEGRVQSKKMLFIR
ncbi:MAG: T9SS type A sorting domain-containing protein, partial [Calditrichia bacterium]